jgi:outer membrane protein assembly factor BamB
MYRREKEKQGVKVFCCYSHEDQSLLRQLKDHLMPLQREGLITLWNDTDILPGVNWKKEINNYINTAQIILLLISPSFMASEYCYSREMLRAMERYESENAHVIPIILRPVDWKFSVFGKLQALPADAKPITSWHNQDEAFLNIAQGVRSVVKRLVMEELQSPSLLGPMESSQVPSIPLSTFPLQTVWPTDGAIKPELHSDPPRLEDQSPPTVDSHVHLPQFVPAHVRVLVPRSRNRKITGRTFVVALLCLVLLVSLTGGGVWTFTKQQQLLNSQHLTATAHATATAAANAYNAAVTSRGVQFGFDAQHTHNNPYERILSPSSVKRLIQAWTALTDAVIFSSPAVVNGAVYVGSNDGKLYAFKADGCGQSTCSPLWTATTGGPVESSPAVVNGVVYVGSDNGNDGGKLYAFKADGCGQASCAPLWTALTGSSVGSSPAVANGVVYVGSYNFGSVNSKLYAFKADGCGQASCAPLWTALTGAPIGSSPAVANGVVYVGSDDGKLYAFKADGCGQASCAPLWTALTGAPVESSPAVANGVVYVGSYDQKLYAFKADGCGQASCAPLWTALTGARVDSSPAVANGVVYVGSGDGKLYAFKADGCGQASCAPLWTALTGALIGSSPAVANGVVYVGSGDGKLYAFKADGCGQASCAPLWTALTGARVYSSPAVANGVVYVGSYDRKLYAFHL